MSRQLVFNGDPMSRLLSLFLTVALAPLLLASNADVTELQIFHANDAAAGDHFGAAVAVYQVTAVLGAPGDDDQGSDAGSAYIFMRVGGGSWVQTSKLVASDGAAGDRFGDVVAITQQKVIVGAAGDDDNGVDSGSVYVHEKSGPNWLLTAKLTASDGAAGDEFGAAISVWGNTIFVGAPGDDDNGPDSGSVYVFEFIANSWTQTAKWTPSDGNGGDRFGAQLALDSDWGVIGATGCDDIATDAGAAYIYQRSDLVPWQPVTKLLPPNGTANDHFGASVSTFHGVVLVGAPDQDTAAIDAGAAYLFVDNGAGSWGVLHQFTEFAGATGNRFGAAVDVSGNLSLVASPGSRSLSLFKDEHGTWKPGAILHPSNSATNDDFASAAQLFGDGVIIGAGAASSAANDAGAVYRYDVTFQPYACGCPGNGGFVPTFRASGDPGPGLPIVFSLTDAPGGANAFLAVGLEKESIPIGGGCSLLVGPTPLFAGPFPLAGAGPGQGVLNLPIIVPIGTPLSTSFTIQTLVVDPTAPLGFTTSNGVGFTIL